MKRRSIPPNEQTSQQKLLKLVQLVVGLILTILYALLLLSWGYEIEGWVGGILFVAVGIPIGILLFRKILVPFFVRIKK